MASYTRGHLPYIPFMATSVNLHEIASFVLTEEGARVYRAWCEELGSPVEHNGGPIVAQRKYSMPLWQVMHVFGHRMYVGGPLLFETNAMELEFPAVSERG